MKKCVASSSEGCSYPIANCRPVCRAPPCKTCDKSKWGNDNGDKWQKPTCGSGSSSGGSTGGSSGGSSSCSNKTDSAKYAKSCPSWSTKYCKGKYESFMK